MELNTQIMKFRQKCISKLKRSDAEYFFDPITMKDLAVFSCLMKIKGIEFASQLDLELQLARYLQIEMITSAVSDDVRDYRYFERFSEVPYECETITLKRRPYEDPENSSKINKTIKEKYSVGLLGKMTGFESEILYMNIPKSMQPRADKVMEHYTTPILGFAAVMKVNVRDYMFLQDLRELLKHIINKHYTGGRKLTKPDARNLKIMQYVLNVKLIKLPKKFI